MKGRHQEILVAVAMTVALACGTVLPSGACGGSVGRCSEATFKANMAVFAAFREGRNAGSVLPAR